MRFRHNLLNLIIYFCVSYIFTFVVDNVILGNNFPMSVIIDKTISVYAIAISISYIFFRKESD